MLTEKDHWRFYQPDLQNKSSWIGIRKSKSNLQKKLPVSAINILTRSKMKKTFVIQVEYPDNDVISSEEVMEVTQECIEHYMELHFGANIMDGDYDRIKVKEVTDGFSLVKRMREKQWNADMITGEESIEFIDIVHIEQREAEREVDEYLNKMEE